LGYLVRVTDEVMNGMHLAVEFHEADFRETCVDDRFRH
jgi:hypothetical protein